MKNKAVLLSVLLVLSACQSPVSRMPSSELFSKEWEELAVLKQKKIELDALSVHYTKKKNQAELDKINAEKKEILKKITNLESRISTLDSNEVHTINNPAQDWRREEELISLNNLELYGLDKKVVRAISTYEAKETRVKLIHTLISSSGYTQFHSNSDETPKPTMYFSMVCDADFKVKWGFSTTNIKANKNYRFELGDKTISNDSRELIFNSSMKSCDLKFTSSIDASKTQYGFKIVNEKPQFKAIENLISTTEACSLKKDAESFFENTEFFNMTCPAKYDSIKTLPEPEDSLHERVIALLGQDLPADFIKKGNPYGELDFSKAPKLDAILVSYLVFRADFYGTLLGRLLAYHADQGTVVRIIVSDVISLDKDKKMYEKLMAKHPNLKVVLYEFDSSQKGGAGISELHRTNHVKIFITYSKEEPQHSMVILGGRNVHDGFVFRTPVDVSAYPEVVNYVSGDESWAYWRDFEMIVRGQDFAESMVRHYMNFYHINKENLVMKMPSVSVSKSDALDSEKEMIRSYVSIPFKDELNLNQFYAKMLDTAKKKILISSPYFRPVKEIAEALDRAIARGVDITIITRLDLEGDTADFILGAVNKDGVNRFLKKVKVYEYTEPKVILHSKLLMIDDEVSFISSVNLNKRSFYHDLENGVVINDKEFTIQMGELYKEYMKISRQITEKQEIIFWKKWIINIFDKVL